MDRTVEQLRNHFSVERELAARLKRSTREERKTIYSSLYNELFARVPDHPRLVEKRTEEDMRRMIQARLDLLTPHLGREDVLVEFAPGDCRLAFALCAMVQRVIGADISDQSGPGAVPPSNFELKVYDGYELDVAPETADIVFSYQFLEHLHPDDVELHLRTAHRILKPGGRYVFATPHKFSGPHDISRFFCDEPEGFHLQEWTFASMNRHLKAVGFRHAFVYRGGRCRTQTWMNAATYLAECIFGWLPRRLQRRTSQRVFQSVTMLAVK